MNRSGPYEFQIVPFSQINPNDYMTISIRGVTHYANGELDFISLQEYRVFFFDNVFAFQASSHGRVLI